MDRIFARLWRNAFFKYFEGLPPSDRVTFWIVVALAFALAISIHGIIRSSSADELSTPPADFGPADTRLA